MPIKDEWRGVCRRAISFLLVFRFSAGLAKPTCPATSTGLFTSKLPGLLSLSFVLFPGKLGSSSTWSFLAILLDQGM